jgi:type I restriction enzyme S subunit
MEDIAAPRTGAIKIGPFGSQLRKEDLSEHGFKVYGQENVIARDFRIGDRRIDTSKFTTLKSCRLFSEDLVITMMGTIGRCALFPPDAEVGIMDSHLLRIQLNPEVVEPRFVALVLGAEETVGRQIARTSHGSIMSGLSSAIVRRLKLPLPPLCEQRRIAEIFDTIDTAIQQTNDLIAKLSRIKQGLMQDLLTRGIDEKGSIRSPKTDRFRNALIGNAEIQIPENWEVKELNRLITIQHGYAFSGKYFTEEECDHVLLTPGNFKVSGGLYFTKHNTKYFTGEIPHDYLLTNGDLLIVMTDLTQEMNILGDVIVLNSNKKILHNQRIGKLRIICTILDPRYLAYLMNASFCKNQIKSTATGTTVKHTSPTRILRTVVPVCPEPHEQHRIAAILTQADETVVREEIYNEKLLRLKHGLMQDLLTGKVRVNCPLDQ